ncbi:hypothetical protein A0H81_06892 [Grifola frondosa]|uniref:Uncharacterized protein n=1 Tax=Grifola frondosa TaxID=5627 RepID=A0A1C7MDY7_GRIFR|nr:hypothetical protein A0H81_06892 [Grifola frondosa]
MVTCGGGSRVGCGVLNATTVEDVGSIQCGSRLLGSLYNHPPPPSPQAGPPRRRSHSNLFFTPIPTLAGASHGGHSTSTPSLPPYSSALLRLDPVPRPPARPLHAINHAPAAVLAHSPETHATVPTKRASSSPHLRVFTRARPPSSASISRPPYTNGYSRSCSRVDSSDDSEDSGAETDDGVMFTSVHPSFADTLRQRILGKGKGRACDGPCVRPITTAPGVLGAGETETEGEDSPRNLPTARITPSSLSYLALPAAAAAVIPFLFEFSRLLSIVPAVFGTLWNLYHVFRPPDDSIRWRVEFFISALWSILTGWQCLQLTTGLLKRWRVYYSPLPTLIRLLALQGDDLLAGDALHADAARARGAAAGVLGGDRDDDMLQPEHPAMGDVEHRRGSAWAGRARGVDEDGEEAKVGLGGGRGQVRAACGRGLLCDGVGDRAPA